MPNIEIRIIPPRNHRSYAPPSDSLRICMILLLITPNHDITQLSWRVKLYIFTSFALSSYHEFRTLVSFRLASIRRSGLASIRRSGGAPPPRGGRGPVPGEAG